METEFLLSCCLLEVLLQLDIVGFQNIPEQNEVCPMLYTCGIVGREQSKEAPLHLLHFK